MNPKKIRIPILILCAFLTFACVYIELPQDLATPEAPSGFGCNRLERCCDEISKTDSGDLRIDLTIQNGTGDWSTMQSVSRQTGDSYDQ